MFFFYLTAKLSDNPIVVGWPWASIKINWLWIPRDPRGSGCTKRSSTLFFLGGAFVWVACRYMYIYSIYIIYNMTYTHTHIYIYIHTYTYIYVWCIYIYICIDVKSHKCLIWLADGVFGFQHQVRCHVSDVGTSGTWRRCCHPQNPSGVHRVSHGHPPGESSFSPWHFQIVGYIMLYIVYNVVLYIYISYYIPLYEHAGQIWSCFG